MFEIEDIPFTQEDDILTKPIQNGCGIYIILNKITGDIYVGSAKNFINRWKEHRYHLNENCHHNIHIQNAWYKYGENAFEFRVLEECDETYLVDREQYYIDYLIPEYNIARNATSPMLGRKHSEETKSKLSMSKIGNTNGIGNKNAKNRKVTENERLHRSEIMIGNNYRLGKLDSLETKRKKSEARLNDKNPMFGRTHSEEAKRKISEARIASKGKYKRSPATKARISEAQLARYKRERES